MILKIDITDWQQEAEEAAVKLYTEDDVIVAMQETDLKPLAAARQLIVNRELGKAQDDVLPANKICLQTGGALQLSRMVVKQRATVDINGHKYDVRRYVASVTTDADGESQRTYNVEFPNAFEDNNNTLVEYTDPAAQERAIQYLMRNVVGRIDERLRIVAAGKGDVGKVAEALKSQIDGVVSKYS